MYLVQHGLAVGSSGGGLLECCAPRSPAATIERLSTMRALEMDYTGPVADNHYPAHPGGRHHPPLSLRPTVGRSQ